MKKRPFLDLISADEAYARIGALPSLGTEVVDARLAAGRVNARDVHSPEDVPHFERSNMDGYAVRAADTAGASPSSAVLLKIAGQVAMGRAADVPVGPGQAVRTSTGAMMPDGADAIVIVENTEETGDGYVAVHAEAVPGRSIVRIGEDLRAGDHIFSPGRRFKGGDVGGLTGCGLAQVEVHEVPRVGIMATGDEIIEPEEQLGPGQVRNVNEYVLTSLAKQCGVTVNDYGVVGDTPERLGATLERAVSENDAVFISGGSSKGTKDLTRSTMESMSDSEILFHGISIAPGKPTILGRAGATYIMGLPGNPAAATVVFSLFGTALIRVLGGEPIDRILLTRPRVHGRLTEALSSTEGREDYIRARLQAAQGMPDGMPDVIPERGKSVAISTVARADGLLRIPASSEGLDAGTEVEVILL